MSLHHGGEAEGGTENSEDDTGCKYALNRDKSGLEYKPFDVGRACRFDRQPTFTGTFKPTNPIAARGVQGHGVDW